MYSFAVALRSPLPRATELERYMVAAKAAALEVLSESGAISGQEVSPPAKHPTLSLE